MGVYRDGRSPGEKIMDDMAKDAQTARMIMTAVTGKDPLARKQNIDLAAAQDTQAEEMVIKKERKGCITKIKAGKIIYLLTVIDIVAAILLSIMGSSLAGLFAADVGFFILLSVVFFIVNIKTKKRLAELDAYIAEHFPTE